MGCKWMSLWRRETLLSPDWTVFLHAWLPLADAAVRLCLNITDIMWPQQPEASTIRSHLEPFLTQISAVTPPSSDLLICQSQTERYVTMNVSKDDLVLLVCNLLDLSYT